MYIVWFCCWFFCFGRILLKTLCCPTYVYCLFLSFGFCFNRILTKMVCCSIAVYCLFLSLGCCFNRILLNRFVVLYIFIVWFCRSTWFSVSVDYCLRPFVTFRCVLFVFVVWFLFQENIVEGPLLPLGAYCLFLSLGCCFR